MFILITVSHSLDLVLPLRRPVQSNVFCLLVFTCQSSCVRISLVKHFSRVYDHGNGKMDRIDNICKNGNIWCTAMKILLLLSTFCLMWTDYNVDGKRNSFTSKGHNNNDFFSNIAALFISLARRSLWAWLARIRIHYRMQHILAKWHEFLWKSMMNLYCRKISFKLICMLTPRLLSEGLTCKYKWANFWLGLALSLYYKAVQLLEHSVGVLCQRRMSDTKT